MYTEPPISIALNVEVESVRIPAWFGEYTKRLVETRKDLLDEVNELSSMKLDQIKKRIGGNPEELPYEFLDTMFITGSDDKEMAGILTAKREKYILTHPEQTRGVSGVEEGISRYNGQFVPKKQWESATMSERRSALVGSTCFHFNSGTPGMDDSPDDRF